MEPGTGTFTETPLPSQADQDRRLAERGRRADREGRRQSGIDQCDVANPASRAKAVEQALAAVGHIDILVNNAAGGGYGTSWDKLTSEHFDRLIETNIKARCISCSFWRRA